MVATLFSPWSSQGRAQKLSITNQNSPLIIAQFSDCHLFADKQAKHLGANVWQNLLTVLADLKKRSNVHCAVFTGDLTQDHSEHSYQHFVDAVQQAQLAMPVFFLAGNHDDKQLLTKYLQAPAFNSERTINHDNWQIQLIDSKSDTPSGLVNDESLYGLSQRIEPDKHQLLMMHHHPINIGYYIDKHGLLNQDGFWQNITQLNQNKGNIKAIACGHVHRASKLSKQNIDIYTCPATSIQFGETKEKPGSIEPSYRLFYLHCNGAIESEIISP